MHWSFTVLVYIFYTAKLKFYWSNVNGTSMNLLLWSSQSLQELQWNACPQAMHPLLPSPKHGHLALTHTDAELPHNGTYANKLVYSPWNLFLKVWGGRKSSFWQVWKAEKELHYLCPGICFFKRVLQEQSYVLIQ